MMVTDSPLKYLQVDKSSFSFLADADFVTRTTDCQICVRLKVASLLCKATISC